MTVATKDLGAKDFDYPQIDLDNYSASFGNARVIGDDENPANEGNVAAPQEAKSEEATNVETPSATTSKSQSESAEVQTQTQKNTAAPVPTSNRPSSNKLSAPIPMAMPESLR
jgi:hypothetical protein